MGAVAERAALFAAENTGLTLTDTVEFDAPRTYYQLTHDYLVPLDPRLAGAQAKGDTTRSGTRFAWPD